MPKSPVPLGKSLAKNKSSNSPNLREACQGTPLWVTLLNEVRENQGPE